MINIFIGALIFSIWSVTLLFGKSIGLSMLLIVVPLTYYLINLLEKNNKIENRKAKIFIIPITLLASTYFIFNNEFFNVINIFIIPLLIVLMVLRLFNEKYELKFNFINKVLGILFAPLSFIGETFEKLIETLRSKLKMNSNKDQSVKKVIKGIVITVPILIVIIALLSSADEIFGNIFIELLKNIIDALSNIKILNEIFKIVLIMLTFCYLLCFFDYISSRYTRINNTEETKEESKDNFTIKMILGALNIVYLFFCIIQIKSLFMRNVDINYSEYARQGFFQLMIVSVINLITILIAKKSENKTKVKENKYINIMCLIMVVFTLIILLSSAVRMYFYESEYGYTLLRLLVYCTLFTESILLIPTIMYIVDKKINLPKAYLTIIITMYVCMNFANFDNIIAKRNIDRYVNTGKIDMFYLKYNTGTDAINQIVQLLEIDVNIMDDTQLQTNNYLKNVYQELSKEKIDFRDFNLSKMFAKHLIEKRLEL